MGAVGVYKDSDRKVTKEIFKFKSIGGRGSRKGLEREVNMSGIVGFWVGKVWFGVGKNVWGGISGVVWGEVFTQQQ